ncbi:MAG: LptF/LptG family permease [Deinococcales bacterium]
MWLRLSRYIVTESFWLYLFGVAAFCLLLSIDYLSVWARFFIEQDASFQSIGKLMLFQSPWFLHMAMPIAAVFAVLLASGRLAKDSELKAAYSLGVPPYRLLFPLLGFALLVSLLALINNGFLEPKAEALYQKEVNLFYSDRPPTEMQLDVSYALENGIYYAGRMRSNPDNRHQADLSGILVVQEDGTRISAQSGTWDSDQKTWTLYDARLIYGDGLRERHDSYSLNFDLAGTVENNIIDNEKLTLGQLWQRWREESRAAKNTRDIAFEFHRRIADAFSAFIFVLVAATLGLHLRGRNIAFAWTIILLVLFYFMWTLSGDLFEKQVLSAFSAAWLTSGVVGVIGLILSALAA